MISSRKTKGQSTLELALMLPILASFLYWITQAFYVNNNASDHSIKQHAQALTDFNHGDSGAVIIDGVQIAPPRYEEVMDDDFHFSPTDILGSVGSGFALQLGLSNLFSHLPFLKDSTYASGFAKGYLAEIGNEWVNTGEMDKDKAARAGLVGALTSESATLDCQGSNSGATGTACSVSLNNNPAGPLTEAQQSELGSFGDLATLHIESIPVTDAHEFFGSGLQGGLVAMARNFDFKNPEKNFEGKQLAGFGIGALGGMLNSDSSRHWSETGNDVLKGASRGALAGSISGLSTGKMDWTQVGRQAASGGFYTKTVARMVPFTSGSKDPRSAASFGAVSAAVGSMALHGGKTTLRDVGLASAAGAFSSSQSTGAIHGTGGRIETYFRTTAADAAFNAAMASVSGGDAQAVQKAVYGGMISDTMNTATSTVSTAAAGVANETFKGVKNGKMARAALKKKETVDEASAQQAAQMAERRKKMGPEE